jgi:thiopeptide-type bacteriocin biosynthesis protein
VARRLPRWIMLADEDNMLPIDLDNVLSVESFVHLVKQRSVAKLVEVFPGPDMLCAHGPEGRFVHELIIPFVRQRAVPGQRAGSHGASHTRPLHVPRTFPPGSAWLYAKLYTGTATADQVLRQVLVPVTRHALATGAASHWFFIRYADPDWHLRLRVHGVPETLHREVLPALQAAAAPFLEDGQLWRVQLDTYEREIERYGGAAGIVLAEQLFHADSEAVLALVDRLEGDAAAEARWRLTLRGIDLLLTDLGFGLDAKCALLTQARDAFARELRTDGLLRRQLGEKFQQERQSLETLLDPARDEASPLLPGLLVLRRRSSHLAPIVAALQAHTRAGQLSVSLAELAVSYIHARQPPATLGSSRTGTGAL